MLARMELDLGFKHLYADNASISHKVCTLIEYNTYSFGTHKSHSIYSFSCKKSGKFGQNTVGNFNSKYNINLAETVLTTHIFE